MTIEQQHLLNLLETALSKLVHDKKLDEAEGIGKVVEYLQNEEPEMAYLEGEAHSVNPAVLTAIKKIHKILY